MNTQEQLDELSRQIEATVSNNKNYHNWDSTTDAFDATQNYEDDSILNMQGGERMKIERVGPSTYETNLLYVNGGGGNVVQAELFGTNFNNGVVVGTTLTYTNGVDSVIVTGIDAPITAFNDNLRSQPFHIAYVKMEVVDRSQFRNRLRFQQDTLYGSGRFNTVAPLNFFEPDQFQNNIINVPVNSSIDVKRRILVDVQSTEVAPGMQMTFFVNGIEDPIRKLRGKVGTIRMVGDGIQEGKPQVSTQKAINQLAEQNLNTTKLLQSVVRKMR